MTRAFFAILRSLRGPEPVVYHGEFRPTEHDRSRVIYAAEIPVDQYGGKVPTLDALLAEFKRRSKAGTLPANLAGRK